jgi:hypothetical protein
LIVLLPLGLATVDLEVAQPRLGNALNLGLYRPGPRR